MATTEINKDQEWTKLLKAAFGIAKHEHDMPPDIFRETVPQWGYPRLSSCSKADLRSIISQMKRWWKAHGSGNYCSQSQLDYLQRLWEIKSDAKTQQSAETYILNSFGETEPRLMSPGTASMVIQSLKKWNN